MKQANQSGWYVNAEGIEVFVPKGQVRPDNHPDVKALGIIFDPLEEEAAPAPAKASRAKKATG